MPTEEAMRSRKKDLVREMKDDLYKKASSNPIICGAFRSQEMHGLTNEELFLLIAWHLAIHVEVLQEMEIKRKRLEVKPIWLAPANTEKE